MPKWPLLIWLQKVVASIPIAGSSNLPKNGDYQILKMYISSTFQRGGYGHVLNPWAVLFEQLSYKRNIKEGCPHRQEGLFMSLQDLNQKSFENIFNYKKIVMKSVLLSEKTVLIK